MNTGPVRHILVVEDNPADARLVREALGHGPVAKQIHVAGDSAEAESFLRSSGHLTDLVLLDLNLPGKTGHELLDEIRRDPQLRQLPVVIFSSSESDEDVRRAYAAHANCYVAKPGDLDRYFSVLASIESFWLSTARLPGMPPPAVAPAFVEPSQCNPR